MHPLTLSDIQWLNLNALDLIRHGLHTDAALTGRQFGLSRPQADRLATVGQRQLWSLVASLGDTALFPPRTDLLELLELPPGLAGPMALARTAPPSRIGGAR